MRVGNKMVLAVVDYQIKCHGIPLHHQLLQGCTQDWHYSVVQVLHKHNVFEALPLLWLLNKHATRKEAISSDSFVCTTSNRRDLPAACIFHWLASVYIEVVTTPAQYFSIPHE